MSRPERILIIGSGAYVIGDRYGPGVVLRSVLAWMGARQSENATVALTCRNQARRSIVEQGAAQAVAQLGSRVPVSVIGVSEIEARLSDHPLAVFVGVPDRVHAAYVELAAKYDVPVWVVKPLTGDLESAERLAAACRSRAAAVWVDYHKRFDTSNVLLRAAVESGQYGRPLHYFVQYSQPRDLPLNQFAWAAEVDPLTYIGCHYLDQLAFVLPGVVAERAWATAIDGPVRRAVGGEAYDQIVCEVALRFRDEAVLASLHVGWANPLGSPSKSFQHVELDCEKGKIRADQMARGFEVWSDAGIQQVNPYFFQPLSDPATGWPIFGGYGFESVARFLDYCVAAPEEQRRLRASQTLPWIESAMFAERVLAAARTSWRSSAGRWVNVAKEFPVAS